MHEVNVPEPPCTHINTLYYNSSTRVTQRLNTLYTIFSSRDGQKLLSAGVHGHIYYIITRLL